MRRIRGLSSYLAPQHRSRPQPQSEHACYLVKQGSSTGHGQRYTMSPTIEECLERARQCEWYAADQ